MQTDDEPKHAFIVSVNVISENTTHTSAAILLNKGFFSMVLAGLQEGV